MAISRFPPVETADETGLLALGGDLDVDSLLLAYRNGIFPWPLYEDLITWFSPPERAVLFFDEFHVPHSLQKKLRKVNRTLCIDRNTPGVIRACAGVRNRKHQRGTWITQAMIEGYTNLHYAGYCHSVECYLDSLMTGGLYGVCVNGFFAGESMFHNESDASKICLCHLVDVLREKGLKWIDCQVMTPLLESFGAREVSRAKFMDMLEEALVVEAVEFP